MSRYNVLKNLFDIKPVDTNGRVDVGAIYNVKPVVNLAVRVNKNLNKKAPTDSTSNVLANSVGAAYSTIPARQPIISITKPESKSSTYVDISNSVDGRGFAPPGSWLTSRNRYYTPSTVGQSYQKRLNPQDELEIYLNSKLNLKKEFQLIGAETVVGASLDLSSGRRQGKPRIRPIFAKQKSGIMSNELIIMGKETEVKGHNSEVSKEYEPILSQINEKIPRNDEGVYIGEPRKIDLISIRTLQDVRPVTASSEIESWVNYTKHETRNTSHEVRVMEHESRSTKQKTISSFKIKKLVFPKLSLKFSKKILPAYVLTSLLGFAIFASLGHYGVSVKNDVITKSNSAVANLEQAGQSLKVFDFQTASSNFTEAYEEFSKAESNLNLMGASIVSLFADLPGVDALTAGGVNKLKSAKNLVEAGKLIAETGKLMSQAVNSLSQTSLILDPRAGEDKNETVGVTINNLKKSLVFSKNNISNAKALLSDVVAEVIPEDKRESFIEFQSKLPILEKVISDATEYTNFLETLVGVQGTKKYLVLFQNNSEIRPTGGFPGTYGVVTFKDGKLLDFLVDDSYNLDGQLKEYIIPPFPLQHITPTWGMRDANWFIDFSTSAEKIMEFFNKAHSASSGQEANYEVDGVITISPQIISEILKVVGAIELPEYDLTIDGENFLTEIQEEVEYGENRQQPKKIVVDMAPKLLERIYSASPDQWMDIFKIFILSLDQKDILMYFKDSSLENFIVQKGFGGLIKTNVDDYLMVNLANIKGSKTDKVTDNYIELATEFEENKITHKLQITRKHNGGSFDYGFYNKQNPAFVRVLVPEGSQLINISGNSVPNFKPLVNYSDLKFEKDKDLHKLESSFTFDKETDTWTYSESGKTGFAFWMIVDPGKKKTVEIEYSIPLKPGKREYNMYIQKQPGLDIKNLKFRADGEDLYNEKFDKDLELKFEINN